MSAHMFNKQIAVLLSWDIRLLSGFFRAFREPIKLNAYT